MLTYAINFLMWHTFHHLVCISPRYMDTLLWTQKLVCPQIAISSYQLDENCKCVQASAENIWTDITQSWTQKYKGRLSSFSRIFYAWHYKTYFNLYDDEHILKRLISSLSEDAGSVLFCRKKKDAAKMSGCLGNVCSISSWLRKLHPNFISIFLVGFFVFKSPFMNVKIC